MSDKIIPIDSIRPKKEELLGAYVWTCKCGCELFLLHECGDVECSDCGRISPDVNVDYNF